MKLLWFGAFSAPPLPPLPDLSFPFLSLWPPSQAPVEAPSRRLALPSSPRQVFLIVSKYTPFRHKLQGLLTRLFGLAFRLPSYRTGSVRVVIMVYPTCLPQLPDALLNTQPRFRKL